MASFYTKTKTFPKDKSRKILFTNSTRGRCSHLERMEGRLARIVAVLAVVSCVWMVEGEKAAGPKTKVPDDKLFSDQPAFCEGCYAVVHGE